MESAEAGTDLLLLSWRRAAGTLALGGTGFLLRETGDNRDTDGFERYSSESRQAGVQADASWRRGAHRIEGGLESRWIREDVLSRRFDPRPEGPRILEDYLRDGWLSAAFVQDTWAAPGGRVSLTLGGRIDHWGATGETVVLPRASLTWTPAQSTRLTAAFGGYAQFPRFSQLAGENANPDLESERSRHLVFAVEQRLPAGLRLRVEAYRQSESRRIFNRELDWRLVDGRVVRPNPDAVLLNTLSGPSRGVEATLAAAGSGRVSGFLAYAWAHAEREDGSGLRFDSDFDQRHTVTAHLRARTGKGVALSTAFRYGSGFPFPGYLRETPAGIFVDSERNRFGPDPYSRWDVRGEKRFDWGRVTLDLFFEVANVLDHENERYNEIDSVNPSTGRARLDHDTMLPLIPLFGATVTF
jgi:outer membrane receptor for ferrienterochelin and colicin